MGIVLLVRSAMPLATVDSKCTVGCHAQLIYFLLLFYTCISCFYLSCTFSCMHGLQYCPWPIEVFILHDMLHIMLAAVGIMVELCCRMCCVL
jgi:hypothetical protein